MCRFVILKEGNIRIPVPVEEAVRFEAGGSYTQVYLKNGTVHTQCMHIGFWEEAVKASGLFIRVHKSHLVHYLQIVSFSKTGGVLLKDGSRLDISGQGYLDLLFFFH